MYSLQNIAMVTGLYRLVGMEYLLTDVQLIIDNAQFWSKSILKQLPSKNK